MRISLALLVILAGIALVLVALPMLQSTSPEADAVRLEQVRAEAQAKIAEAQARQAEAPVRAFLWTMAGAILVVALAALVLSGGIALLQVATRGVWLYWEAFLSGLAVSRMAVAPEPIALPAPEPWRGKVLSGPAPLALPVGVDQENKEVFVPLDGSGSLLLGAGQSGYGKSSLMRAQICALADQQQQGKDVKIAVVNPKQIDLAIPQDSRLLWAPVAVTPSETLGLFEALMRELDKRNEFMAGKGQDLFSLTGLGALVIYIDELSVVMEAADRSAKVLLLNMLRTGRAAGFFVVAVTQSPRASVIPGEVKTLASRRFCLAAPQADSQLVLGNASATTIPMEKGAAIYQHSAPIPVRLHHVEGDTWRQRMDATRTGRPVPEIATPPPMPLATMSKEAEVERLLRLGMSQASVEMEVYNSTGGSASRKVKAIKERMQP